MAMRKGVEQPQVIVYVLFVVVLTLTGIYVAFTQLGGVSIQFTFHDYASRLNIAATRLMLTPECFAVENSYNKGVTSYQVDGGTIDWQKFYNSKFISDSCVPIREWTDNSGKTHRADIWINLTEINGKYSDTIWSCPFVCSGDKACEDYGSKSSCEDESDSSDCGWGIQPCSEPTNKTRADPDEWLQISRSYFVLIKNGTTTDSGILTLRLRT